MKKFIILIFYFLLCNIVLANEETIIELHNKSLDQLEEEKLEIKIESQLVVSVVNKKIKSSFAICSHKTDRSKISSINKLS